MPASYRRLSIPDGPVPPTAVLVAVSAIRRIARLSLVRLRERAILHRSLVAADQLHRGWCLGRFPSLRGCRCIRSRTRRCRNGPGQLVATKARTPRTVVPMLVITEVVYLLATRLGVDAEVRFLGDLASGNLIPEPVASADWLRIAELIARYRDLPLGTVAASVVAAAERLAITEVATLDGRHFSVVQATNGPLNLLP